MNGILSRALLALALMGGYELTHAEGAGPRSAKSHVPPQRSMNEFALTLSPDCAMNDAQWQLWRDGEITKLLARNSETERHLDSEDVMGKSTKTADFLDKCSDEGRPAPEAITGNLARFVRTQRNANFNVDLKHQSGHRVEDHEYLRRAGLQLELPCLLKQPEFLEKISVSNTYFDAFQLIKAQNNGTPFGNCPLPTKQWMVLVYRSNFLPTPDNAETFGRFLVMVPAESDGYDRWIQFGIWLPEDRARAGKMINNVSVVAVAVAKGDPKSDPRFDALADWWRIPKDGELGFQLKYRREVQPFETDNCLSCHKTLPIGIHPQKVYTFDGGTGVLKVGPHPLQDATVKALNGYIFKNYKRAPVYATDSTDNFASPHNYGPPLGWDTDDGGPVRTSDSLRTCTALQRLKPKSVKRVIEQMNCGSCHNGKNGGFGMLNYPLATDKRIERTDGALTNLVRSHIVNKVMPIDLHGDPVSLSDPERKALYECLSMEYFDPKTNTGLFVDWLKNRAPQSTSSSGVVKMTPALIPTKHNAKVMKSIAAATSPPTGFDRCAYCHMDPAQAPSLVGVYQRPLASDKGYSDYSPDLREAGAKGLVWNEDNLMAFLKGTDAFLTEKLGRPAESNMAKRYPDESFRRVVVQYLMTLK